MIEAFIRQAILHAIIAAGVVEALLTTWRIRSAGARLQFWLIALAAPLLLLPIVFLAVPSRLDDHFAAGSALFASTRWNPVRLVGLPVDRLVLGLLVLLGCALLVRDLLPLVLRWERSAAGAQGRASRDAESSRRVAAIVAQQAARLGAALPAVRVLACDAPVLFVRGIRRCTLLVSTGLTARLSDEELAAAVTHELAHVRFRDPLLGWLLMAARILMFWNPAVQLVARAIAQETEHRADAVAVRASGPRPYRAAFCLLASPGEHARSSDAPAGWRRLVARVHREHVEARTASLVVVPDEPPWLAARLATVAGVLAALLFFVV